MHSCALNVPDLRLSTEQHQRTFGFSYPLCIKAHVCNSRSSVSSHSHRTTKPCHALPTNTSERLPTTENAILQPQMHCPKYILAAIGIFFALASPVPQDNNDTLESFNTDCTTTYPECSIGSANTVEDSSWHVTQWMFKLVVPLLTTHSLA